MTPSDQSARLLWTLRRDGDYIEVDLTGPIAKIEVGTTGYAEEPAYAIELGSADAMSLANAIARWAK